MTETRFRRHRLRLATLLGVVATFSFTGFSSAANQTIEASGLSWSPSTTTVTTADTLTIKNPSSTLHSVSWDGGPTTPNCTGVPGTGQANWTGTCTFSQAGSYSFFCTVHGQSMSADVTVNSAGPGAPIVSTSAATSITDTGATLKGTVNPNGLATEYFFKYGTSSTPYASETGKTSLSAGTSPEPASTGVTGLTAATTYHFKLFATNTSGTSQGSDLTFTTTGPPLPTTSAATPVGSTTATLRGTVNPRGHATTYFFGWGKTASYGEETSGTSAGSGTSATPASATLSNLSPETTYHFKLYAINTSGTTEGGDLTFTTKPVDTTDPQTTIKGKPADPSSSTTAEFTYESNEAGSTFECKMDGESFTACPSTGKTYTGLGEGPHTFQVRATDSSLNTDESPASYSFSVVLPTTPPVVTPPPPPPDPSPAVAPNTTITFKPKATTKDRTPTFKFKSTVAGATYECKLDGKALKPCRSPLTTKPLSYARHTLKVASIAGGLKDSSPAVASFKVVKPK
jgi:plastocyanin